MSQKEISPVTGSIDESLVILDFGKYEGRSVEEVAHLDRKFYEKLSTEKQKGIFAIRRHRSSFQLYENPALEMNQ